MWLTAFIFKSVKNFDCNFKICNMKVKKTPNKMWNNISIQFYFSFKNLYFLSQLNSESYDYTLHNLHYSQIL